MRQERTYCVYILASGKNGTIYIGVTNDLGDRLAQHRGIIPEETRNPKSKSFTKKYGVDKLVYFEEFADIEEAIHREKRLKKWNREWKIALIEKENPGWKDLGEDFLEE